MGTCTSKLNMERSVIDGTLDCATVHREWSDHDCTDKLRIDELKVKGDINPNTDLEFFYYNESNSNSNNDEENGDGLQFMKDMTNATKIPVQCNFLIERESGYPHYIREWAVHNKSACVTREGETKATMKYLHTRYSTDFLAKYPWMATPETPPLTEANHSHVIKRANHSMEWYTDVHYGCPAPPNDSNYWENMMDVIAVVVVICVICIGFGVAGTSWALYTNYKKDKRKKAERQAAYRDVVAGETTDGDGAKVSIADAAAPTTTTDDTTAQHGAMNDVYDDSAPGMGDQEMKSVAPNKRTDGDTLPATGSSDENRI